MRKRRDRLHLTASEYVVQDREGQNRQIAAARRQFIKAVRSSVPAFFERLRSDVYPTYARRSKGKPRYWKMGWKFSTWQILSDADGRVTPILVGWAREFNVEREEWILEGALQTLSDWHQAPKSRRAMEVEVWRFCQFVAESRRITEAEHRFQFEDSGWDPTFISCAGWRANVKKRFEEALKAHEQKMRGLAKERGLVRAVLRASTEHFEWLALYHCGGHSLARILTRAPHAGNSTTISRGIHSAARLACLSVRAKRSKLKNG